MCQWMAPNSQYTLPPQSFPQKNAGGKSWLCSKWSSNEPSPGNFLTVGGYFEHHTCHITALGWLKKKRKKEEDDFWPFQVCHFKIVDRYWCKYQTSNGFNAVYQIYCTVVTFEVWLASMEICICYIYHLYTTLPPLYVYALLYISV